MKNAGLFLLNISVALYFFATGILGFSGKKILSDSGEIRRAVTSLFKGDFAEFLIVILALVSILAGVFVLLKFFGILTPIAELCLIICAIVWVVFIIMIDIVDPINSKNGFSMVWLKDLGAHLMVLGGISLATGRFSSK